MSKIGGLAGVGGFGSGGGLFGMGGVRVMDGTKQLYLQHVTRTLPPSLTGFPMEAEIRYYIKVTIQRPGLLKENWRYQIGFKFLPIEPPKPARTGQEAFARRPFTFRPRSPIPGGAKKSSFFFKRSDRPEKTDGDASSSGTGQIAPDAMAAPSVEMSARLPHPSVLACNQPVPLRLLAKKLVNCPEQVTLVSLQMDLIGITEVRSQTIHHKRVNRWVVVSSTDLNIPLTAGPDAPVGSEVTVPDTLWTSKPLPNTVAAVICDMQHITEVRNRTQSLGFVGANLGMPVVRR